MTASPTTEEMVEGGLRSSLLGIVINLALALVKCLAGLIGHSFALLADGIESVPGCHQFVGCVLRTAAGDQAAG